MDEIRTAVWLQTAVRSSKIALCRQQDGLMGLMCLRSLGVGFGKFLKQTSPRRYALLAKT